MTNGIEARELTKVFHDPGRGDVVAANQVSFTCQPGEIFGLLGPNGAGKTTTLRMLSTVLQPTSGTAIVAGHDVVGAPLELHLRDAAKAGDLLEPFEECHAHPTAAVGGLHGQQHQMCALGVEVELHRDEADNAPGSARDDDLGIGGADPPRD